MASKRSDSKAMHAWLIWMKAGRAVREYALLRIEEAGLGESDFRVLEVLLHGGPMPVNTIGPKVNLNPGSVSVAVDRLHKKGLVTRTEDTADRRVRMVSLTDKGDHLIRKVFAEHCRAMEAMFAPLSPAEIASLERLMRKIGMHTKQLLEGQAQKLAE